MANWLTRALGWGGGAAVPVGAFRPGPYMLSNGWLPAGNLQLTHEDLAVLA